MQGQSRKGTILRLDNGIFTGASNPTACKPVLMTGDGVAQNFDKGVYNLTVKIGANNPGATGIYFYSNNEGMISDVDIISEDGQGDVGLHMGTGEQGPCMARRIYVKGFKYGAWVNALNTVTMSQISLEGESTCGLRVDGRIAYVDSLTSTNSVEAVYNGGELALINAFLTGGASTAYAIESHGKIYARNVTAQGYQKTIMSSDPGQKVAAPTGMTIDEYCAYGGWTLFNSPLHSLNLPIKRPPDVEWEQNPAKWAVIEDYKTGSRTDVQALQAAIDDTTKTSICLTPAWHKISSPVYIRGNIKRIVGTSLIGCDWATSGPVAGTFIVQDGTQPVVIFQRLSCQWTGISQQSSRTIIAESFVDDVPGPVNDQILASGTGDLFIVNAATRLKVTNPLAHIWAWQFNSEQQSYFFSTDKDTSQDYNLKVLGGTVWIFGYKTEVYGTKGQFFGGATEILGFYNYLSERGRAEPAQFYGKDANFSIVCGSQLSFNVAHMYDTLVKVTRQGVTKSLIYSQTTNPAVPWDNYYLPLFANYDSGFVLRAQKETIVPCQAGLFAAVRQGKNIVVTYAAPRHSAAEMRLIDAKSRTVGTRMLGTDSQRLHASAFSAPSNGAYFVDLRAGRARYLKKVLIME
jgi:hypothetical protein